MHEIYQLSIYTTLQIFRIKTKVSKFWEAEALLYYIVSISIFNKTFTHSKISACQPTVMCFHWILDSVVMWHKTALYQKVIYLWLCLCIVVTILWGQGGAISTILVTFFILKLFTRKAPLNGMNYQFMLKHFRNSDNSIWSLRLFFSIHKRESWPW